MAGLFFNVEAATVAREAYSNQREAHVRAFLENSTATSRAWSPRRFNLLGPAGPRCTSTLERYGRGDDEKRACSLSARASPPCTVVSIGSNNQWGFESAIANRTGCAVHVFDCTVASNTRPPLALRSRVVFHHLCIANHTFDDAATGRSYINWQTLLRRVAGQNVPPLFLKMDVEGFEFGVMRDILTSGALPEQVAIELHWRTYVAAARTSGWPWRCRGSSDNMMYECEVPPEAISQWSDELWRRGRYMLIDRHDNPRSRYCTEVLLARM